MKVRWLQVLLAVLAQGAGPASAKSPELAALKISVSHLRNRSGLLRLALFRTAEGYPEDNTRAYRTLSVGVCGDACEVSLPQVPAGTWALAVLHDENSNGKLDRNFLGIPVEGVGASNAAASRLGPPKFEDARFVVGTDDVRLGVGMVYWL